MQPNEKALYILDESPYLNGKQLCLHVTKEFKKGCVCFHDTDRGHMIEGTIDEEYSNGFIFIDSRGRKWVFREVTIQEYRHKISKHTINGENIAKLCKTTEDLWEFYRREFTI